MKRREITRRVAATTLGVTLAVAGLMVPSGADTVKAATLKQPLVVKCQNVAGTTANTETTNVRLVAGVDSLEYKKVGFEIQIGDSASTKQETAKVFTSIIADGKVINASDFSSGAQYLATTILSGIKKADYEKGIYIKPYVETKDGEVLYGTDRYVNVCNGYDGSFNVAIRVSGNKEIGAGLAYVTYDNEKLEYVASNAGTLLKEVEVYNTGNEVRFVNNVEDVTKNVKADGILMNIRFKVKNYDPVKKSEYKFDIKKSEFCNVAEEDVTGLTVTADSVSK